MSHSVAQERANQSQNTNQGSSGTTLGKQQATNSSYANNPIQVNSRFVDNKVYSSLQQLPKNEQIEATVKASAPTAHQQSAQHLVDRGPTAQQY